MRNFPISWRLVSDAVRHYTGFGYRYVEVPWIVRKEPVLATLPEGRQAFETVGGVLVGSAEQSFIQMMQDGELPPGRYAAASPCFRDEDDPTHQTTFFKVELIHVLDGPPRADQVVDPHVERMSNLVNSMAVHARWFFRSVAVGWDFRMVRTLEGLDIELNGLELGSYGYRSFQGHHWIYGTGVAEPRLSMALAGKDRSSL